jgi:transcriptional regulator with XRE-family HTH domain
MSRDAFGPNLRRLRVQRGISLDHIAKLTNVPGDLFAGLESNDFSRWPTGIYARAYVRQYACAIGVDPDSTVDEFCRWYLNGDRRAEPVVREQSQIVGHELAWKDEVPPSVSHDRRGRPAVRTKGSLPSPSERGLIVKLKRALGKA